MPLIRRLLGPSIAGTFDLDRDEGPRNLVADPVYLFSDPLQEGFAFAEWEAQQLLKSGSPEATNFIETGEDEMIILRHLFIEYEADSGLSSSTIYLQLQTPAPGGSADQNIYLFFRDDWAPSSGDVLMLTVENTPALQDLRIPPSSLLRVGRDPFSSIDLRANAYFQRYPAQTFVAK